MDVCDVEGAFSGEDDFIGEGALAGDDFEVVVGVDVEGLSGGLVGEGGLHGFVVAIAGEDDGDVFGAEA